MLGVASIIFALAAAVVAIVVLIKLKPSTSFGSAKFGDWPGDTAKKITDLPAGIVCGKTQNGDYASWGAEGHWLAIAPTGAGKSTGILMPSIVNWKSSLVAIDIKGELARSCHAQLQLANTKCLRLDPFGLLDDTPLENIRLNPITKVFKANDKIEAIKSLANTLIDSDTTEDHWSQSARMLVAGLIGAAGDSRKNKSLSGVHKVTTEGNTFFKQLQKLNYSEDIAQLVFPALQMIKDAGVNERGAILSTVRRQVSFLDNQKIAYALQGDWEPDELLSAKPNPVALFIVLPPEYLATQHRFLRVVIGFIVQAMLNAGTSTSRRLLFALDEAATLGNLELVSSGVGLFRGYGATFLLSFQDYSQLETTYGSKQAQSIQANCNTLLWNCRDQATCEAVSNMLGKQTVVGSSRNLAQTPLVSGGASAQHEVARALLTPDEIRRLAKDEILAIMPSSRPVKLQLLPPKNQ